MLIEIEIEKTSERFGSTTLKTDLLRERSFPIETETAAACREVQIPLD